mgnify:CR=1 FL=1
MTISWWSRRKLTLFSKATYRLCLLVMACLVHAFVHVCNFQSMQCQKICVGHVRASIELCFKKGFSKATLGSSFTLNWEKKKYRSVRPKRHTAWFLIFQKRELKHRDGWSPQVIFWPYARSKKPDGLTAKGSWFGSPLPLQANRFQYGWAAFSHPNQAYWNCEYSPAVTRLSNDTDCSDQLHPQTNH